MNRQSLVQLIVSIVTVALTVLGTYISVGSSTLGSALGSSPIGSALGSSDIGSRDLTPGGGHAETSITLGK